MTGTYQNVFGGTVVYPSDVSYRAVSLTADVTLEWPTELATSTDVVARIMNVTPSTTGLTMSMPAANLASVGETTLIFNVGSHSFTVADYDNNTIVSIAPGLAYQIFMTGNATEAGVWTEVNYGAGTSSATAGSLAGLGIKAIGTTLNQSMSVTEISLDYTFLPASDRSELFVWTGGAGTLTLPLAATTGNDWFVNIRNGGSGAITIQPSGSDQINDTNNYIFNPGDSATVICSGTAWYTIGFGQASEFVFDYVSIDLTGAANPYVLTGAELNRVAYSFGGAIVSDYDIIVPATTQQYWVTNSTTGGHSLTIKTLAGSGITVANGESAILYCNGTNVVDADSSGIAYPIAVALGGTGATNATGARANLSAAKLGINSDITQLAGLDDGGASGPAITFSAESNTGIYRSGTGALSVALSGSQTATFSTSGLNLASGDAYSINGSSVLSATTLGTGVTASSLTSVGTLTSGALGTGFTTVNVAQGGTGAVTLTSNGVVYGNGTSAVGVTAAGTTGQVLVGNTGAAPSWATLSGIGVTSLSFGTTGLTPSTATTGAITVAGTLGVANGGTGATTLTGYVKGSGTSALTASATIPTSDLSGTVSLTTQVSGTLGVANGGTGVATLSSGYLLKGNGTSAVSTSVVYDNGTNVGIGTSSPSSYGKLTVAGNIVFGSPGSRNAAFTNNIGIWTTGDPADDTRANIGFTTVAGAASSSSYITFATNNYGVSGGERMRIDQSGNVGIGTTGPDQKLVVNGSARVNADIVGAAGNTGALGVYGGASYIGGAGIVLYGSSHAISPNVITFNNGSYTERMRIDSSGNVGIGTSSPYSRFTVVPSSTPTTVAGANQITVGESTANSAYRLQIGYLNNGAGGYNGSIQVYDNGNAQSLILNGAGGNVGIGTSSPSYKLTVQSSNSAAGFERTIVRRTGDQTNFYRTSIVYNDSASSVGPYAAYSSGIYHEYGGGFGASGGLTFATNSANAGPITFATADTERMRIDSSGNVGIGTSSPSTFAKLSVVSSAFNGFYVDAQGVASNAVFNKNNTSGGYLVFNFSGVGVGSVTTNGTTTSYNTTSDRRLKHDIVDAPAASDLIDAIKVRGFKWNADDSEQRYGFIAQELVEVAPEAVHVPEDEDQMMAVDYSKLVPMLVKELQSVRARLAILEGK